MTFGEENFYSTRQLANRLGVTTRYLETLRTQGDGPRFLKFGRSVRYAESAVQEWLAAREYGSTTEEGK